MWEGDRAHSISRSFLSALLACLVVAAAASLGSLAMFTNNVPWYDILAKPAFSPPKAVFGPVWMALYCLMAFAFWRLLRLPPGKAGRRTAIILFLAQLGLNVLWAFLFFGAHSPPMGLIDIVPEQFAAVATVAAFWPLDRSAALALVPLAAWDGFEGLLNLQVWRMSG
jgi:translocator protein